MRSFRTQVVLWIAGVVALALIVLGTAMSIVNVNQLASGMDRDLRNRGEMMARNGGPPFGEGPGGPRGGQGGPLGPGPGPRGQGFQQVPRDPMIDSDVLASLRRPRVLLPDGSPRNPNAIDDILDRGAFERAAKFQPGHSTTVYRGERVRVYSTPMVRDGSLVGVVQVANELRPIDQLKAVEIRTMLSTIPVAVIGAVLVALFLTGRVMRPIGEMSSAAKSIADGDYSTRLPTQGLDEFAQLGEQFNHMAEKVEASVTGLQAALDQQRQFTADASHELRTPLTRMRLATSAGLTGPDADAKDALRVADDAGKDMSKLVQQLLDLARADTGDLSRRFEPVDLRLVASEAVAKVTSPVPIDVELAESAVTIPGDAHHLERVCLNLLENAIRHTESGRIVLRVSGHPATIEVEDTGSGIAEEHLPHLKERFYRIDSARDRGAGGSGLGLAIVDEVVRAHGGKLEISSQVGKGTRVRATFDPKR